MVSRLAPYVELAAVFMGDTETKSFIQASRRIGLDHAERDRMVSSMPPKYSRAQNSKSSGEAGRRAVR